MVRKAVLRVTEEAWGFSGEIKDNLLKRLRRIEGQARGVQRMIEEERSCQEIMMQLAALKSSGASGDDNAQQPDGACIKQEISGRRPGYCPGQIYGI